MPVMHRTASRTCLLFVEWSMPEGETWVSVAVRSHLATQPLGVLFLAR